MLITRKEVVSVWNLHLARQTASLPVKVAMLALVAAISHAWRSDPHGIEVGVPVPHTPACFVRERRAQAGVDDAWSAAAGVGRGEGERCGTAR